MSDLPLIVAQYELRGHPRRTEHWALAVIINTSTSQARVFQMIGTTDTFGFEARNIDRIDMSKKYCGGVEVGRVSRSGLEDLETWLKAVPIHRFRPDWDCQSWVIDALRELVGDRRGVVFPNLTESGIRAELEEEKERLETGHDLIHDRLKGR